MCHSATARPTHGVVVGRAVFVAWNPPTTTRSRTRTVFVFCFSPASCCTSATRRCNVGGGRKVTRASSGAVLARQLFLRVPDSSEFRRPPPAHQIGVHSRGRFGSLRKQKAVLSCSFLDVLEVGLTHLFGGSAVSLDIPVRIEITDSLIQGFFLKQRLGLRQG